MEIIKTIKLHTREVRHDRQVFYTSAAEINGKWYQIKFTKECQTTPKKRGLYDLQVNIDDISLAKGKQYVSEKTGEICYENDILWVNNTVSLRAYSDEELKEENRETISAVFGD